MENKLLRNAVADECHDLPSIGGGDSVLGDASVPGGNEPMLDGAYIDDDLVITPRTRRNYLARGILPAPDANLLGRDLWRASSYAKFKADLLAGKFSLKRRPPHLRDQAVKS
jgi:hypothetical protein